MTDTAGPPSSHRCAFCDAEEAADGSTCPQSIACPSCGAGPGRRCRRASGHAARLVHPERLALAESLDADAGIVYERSEPETVADYPPGLDVDAAVRAALDGLPPFGDRWVRPARLDGALGDLSVIRVRPGRIVHVIGYGPVHDRVRAAISAGRLAGWSLHPVRDGTTPLQELYEPLRRACGTKRLYAPLERSAFATVEQVEATPDAGLAHLTNIGRTSIPIIRQVVTELVDPGRAAPEPEVTSDRR